MSAGPRLSEAGKGQIEEHQSHNMTFSVIAKLTARHQTTVFNYFQSKIRKFLLKDE